jgi:GTP-binding protein EngB required for normal cell division
MADRPTLNEFQKRHLLATLRHVDAVLLEAEAIMAASRSEPAFPRYSSDLPPPLGDAISERLRRFRGELRAAADALGLGDSGPMVGTRRAVHAQLLAASIALEEADAARLRGYGAVTPEAAETVGRISAALRRLLERMDVLLQRAPDRDVESRLERLAGTREEATLLAELGRIVARHRLVELEPLIASLLSRLESNRLRIALFGRVSSGKSSLINHILRRDVLPVGPTPVTSVPVEIESAPEPYLVAHFADRAPETMPLERLAELASEAQNPGNRRHVMRLRVGLQEPRLVGGITLTDTPGLGSLATAGAELAMAFLPECDLGVLLVDAAGALAAEDIRVLDALFQAGARATVLVSKADLLDPAQSTQVASYVAAHTASGCGFPVPVHLVSVTGDSPTLAEAWFESEVLPLCLDRQAVASVALRRKIGALREAVIATLRHRLDLARAGAAGGAPDAREDREVVTSSVPREAETVAREIRAVVDELCRGATRALGETAAELARSWPPSASPLAEVEAAAASLANEVAARVAARLETFRGRLREALAVRAGETGSAPPSEELPRVAGLPLWVPPGAMRSLPVPRPAAGFLGAGYRRTRLTQLLQPVAAPLERAFGEYRGRLGGWSREVLGRLLRSFETQMDSRGMAPTGGAVADTPADVIAADLQCLLDWPADDEHPADRSAAGARSE